MNILPRVLPVFVCTFFTFFYLNATAVICDSPEKENCLKMERVYKSGTGWIDACCWDFVMQGDQSCTDDCSAIGGNNDDGSNRQNQANLVSDKIYEGFKWKERTTGTSHTLEFINDKLYFDGKYVLSLKESITAILFELPGSNGVCLKLGYDEPVKSEAIKALSRKVGEGLIRGHKEDLNSSKNVKVIPNPIAKNETITLSSTLSIHRVLIYDLNGKVVYKNEVQWEDVFKINNPGLREGVYTIRFMAREMRLPITRKIIILDL